MTRPRLIATDLDGTFLSGSKTYDHQRLKNILAKMNEKNAHFIVSTGRDESNVNRIFKDFIGQIDLVLDNGALVRTADGEILRESTLSKDELKHAMDVVQQMPFRPRFGAAFASRKKLYMLHDQARMNWAHTLQLRLAGVDLELIDQVDDIPEEILKFTIAFREEDTIRFIDQAQAVIGTAGHVTTSGYGSVDIVGAGVNKATGLDVLAQHYGYTLEEELAAFGDGLNDYEMLKVAGFPWAMPNSDPRLLDGQFDVAMADNEHAGVFKTIETLWY
jgi:FMN hydrolase / 5-amino-6-(5-phospho-D-ribitylamino)uracil phosphatase